MVRVGRGQCGWQARLLGIVVGVEDGDPVGVPIGQTIHRKTKLIFEMVDPLTSGHVGKALARDKYAGILEEEFVLAQPVVDSLLFND